MTAASAKGARAGATPRNDSSASSTMRAHEMTSERRGRASTQSRCSCSCSWGLWGGAEGGGDDGERGGEGDSWRGLTDSWLKGIDSWRRGSSEGCFKTADGVVEVVVEADVEVAGVAALSWDAGAASDWELKAVVDWLMGVALVEGVLVG